MSKGLEGPDREPDHPAPSAPPLPLDDGDDGQLEELPCRELAKLFNCYELELKVRKKLYSRQEWLAHLLERYEALPAERKREIMTHN